MKKLKGKKFAKEDLLANKTPEVSVSFMIIFNIVSASCSYRLIINQLILDSL